MKHEFARKMKDAGLPTSSLPLKHLSLNGEPGVFGTKTPFMEVSESNTPEAIPTPVYDAIILQKKLDRWIEIRMGVQLISLAL